MSVEVDYYILKRQRDDVLVNSSSIPPGSNENITFLNPRARLIIFSDIDGTRGRVWILGKALHKRVQAVIYENTDDIKGKPVKYLDRPIEIEGEQELGVSTKRGRKREVCIYIEPGEDESDSVDIPQDTRPLVMV